ncbi:MAG: multidrug efflux SMR transporter [Planctomycetes bacterium]|nr:multidrug efflux SMR transporter [Planctomycetota bacterium]
MNWIYLLIGGLFEVGWSIGLIYTQGFTRLWPTVLTVSGMLASVFFLALAVRDIPLGTAYAIWTGIGAVGAVIAGMILFGESTAGPRMIFIAIIVLGIVGLKMTSGH